MKILVIDTDYQEHIENSYRKYPNLSSLSYVEQKKALEQENSGPALPCVRALSLLGHEVELIIVNNERLQKAWIKEHSLNSPQKTPTLSAKLHYLIHKKWGWQEEILEAQVRAYKPDVIYSITRDLDTAFNMRIKKLTKLYVLQIASKLPTLDAFKPYDFVVSSLPNQV